MMELVNLITKNLTLDLHNTDFHKKKKEKKKKTRKSGACVKIHSKCTQKVKNPFTTSQGKAFHLPAFKDDLDSNRSF